MPDGEDFLMAPVLNQMCSFESLKDGSLDLADIALMNDALMVRRDNEEMLRQNPDG